MRTVMSLALLGLVYSPLEAQQVRVSSDQRIGKQRITEFEPVPAPGTRPPGGAGQALGPDGVRPPVFTTQSAKDWKCGKAFTDQDGRRWNLALGQPLKAKPDTVSGWLYEDDGGSLLWFLPSGQVYRPVTAMSSTPTRRLPQPKLPLDFLSSGE